MAISGKMILILGLEQTGTADLTSPVEKLPDIEFDVAAGTGADQMDLLWSDQRTLVASNSEDLDLSGSLVNSFGATMAFAEMRLLVVKASADNTNDVIVGGAAANQMINWVGSSSDTVIVKPGGILFLYAPDAAGYAVTAGTGDILQIENSAGSTPVTYDIYIGRVSA